MRILYDNQVFTISTYGGVARYFSELIKHLQVIPSVTINLPISYSDCAYLTGIKQTQPFSRLKGHEQFYRLRNKFVRKTNRSQHRRNDHQILDALKQRQFDVFHPTFYGTDFLNHLNGKPYVLTIFDMIHENFPDMYPESDDTPTRKRLLAEKATKIIAISESTRQDILRTYNVSAEKVVTIHLGHTPVNPAKTNRSEGDFILYVGTRELYKNFIFFVQAAAPILRRYKIKLVCAGGGAFTRAECMLFRENHIDDIVLHKTPTDAELAQLYIDARTFVYPSRYEGFGLPIIEAFAYGCPVILSRASCFLEIASESAEYFDLMDARSLTIAIEKVISDNDYRNELISRGLFRSNMFSWADCAKKTFDVYQNLS